MGTKKKPVNPYDKYLPKTKKGKKCKTPKKDKETEEYTTSRQSVKS